MLQLKDVSLAFTKKVLFQDVSVQLYKNQRIGLVGKNGAGKTSFFKLLLNEIHADKGDVFYPSDTLVSYIEQEITNVDELLIEYVLNSHYIYREEHYDLPEYYQLRPNAEKLLSSLGFKQHELELPLKNFSGGWQMRANLAKALFCASDLLLLDEPTNHLDVETVMWLEKWLSRYAGLAIIISHDREFLDNVTTHTLHIANSRIKLYGGNYSTFERTLAEQLELQQKQEEKSSAKIAHLQSFVDRFKAKASKAKQAQSRMKMIEKLQFSSSLYSERSYTVEFFEPEALPNLLLSIVDADIGYGDNVLIDKANFQLFAGARVGLLGKNGRGKSSLIKSIISNDALLNGVIDIGEKTKIGYFAQNTVDTLDLSDTPLNLISRVDKSLSQQYLLNYLGKFGFTGETVGGTLEQFSGGEKSRLVLAMIVLQKPNILFLDEPTNHLDMTMRETLTEALQDFAGALVLVSHDKFMLQSVVDEYYLIDKNELRYFDGDLDDYYQYLSVQEKELANKQKNGKSAKPTKNKSASKISLNEVNKELDKLNKAKQQLTNDISNTGNDLSKLTKLQKQLDTLQSQLDDLEVIWLELSV